MKTTLLVRILAAAFALPFASCFSIATTIPAEDLVQPRIELRITGPVIRQQVLTNPPRESWEGPGGSQYMNLAPRTSYHFALFVRDAGGVGRATFELPASLEVSDLVGEGLVEEISGIRRRLTVRGNRASPVRVLSLSGRFNTRGNSGAVLPFSVEANDFGGASGSANQRFLGTSALVDV